LRPSRVSVSGFPEALPEPKERDQDASDPFLLLNTLSTSTRTHVCFRIIVTDSSSGVYVMGCRPPRPETCAFHDAPNRFGGSSTYRGGVLVRTHNRRSTEPLTSLSRSSSIPGRAFRGARFPIRRDSPRPLPPHRRDAIKFFPVRNAFPRQEMRCSSSGLSTGDRAPTHQNPTRRFDSVLRFPRGRSARCCCTSRSGHRLFVTLGSSRHA
jgi:hypothetical protein